eukprot:GHVH01005802.1.p1 GENE.GHVH01005802.1~~GHVH01005802.1.p1  ORF type:complete len:977 (+),score=149.91 GHVH01005802.1:181-3111(+)
MWNPRKLFPRESVNEPLNEQRGLSFPLHVFDFNFFLSTGWNVLHQRVRDIQVYCSSLTHYFPVDQQSCRIRFVHFGTDYSSVNLIPRGNFILGEEGQRNAIGNLFLEQKILKGVTSSPSTSISYLSTEDSFLTTMYGILREYTTTYPYIPANSRCFSSWGRTWSHDWETMSGVVIYLALKRLSKYYVNNTLLQLLYVIMASVSIQWLPFYLYDRCSSLMAIMLICVTIVTVHSGTKTYLESATLVDLFVVFSYMTVLFPLVETAVVTRLRAVDEMSTCRKVMRWQKATFQWFSNCCLATLIVDEWISFLELKGDQVPASTPDEVSIRARSACSDSNGSAARQSTTTEEARHGGRESMLPIYNLLHTPSDIPPHLLFDPVTEEEAAELELKFDDDKDSESIYGSVSSMESLRPTGINRRLRLEMQKRMRETQRCGSMLETIVSKLDVANLGGMGYPSVLLDDTEETNPLKFAMFCDELSSGIGSMTSSNNVDHAAFIRALKRDSTLEFAVATNWGRDTLTISPPPPSPLRRMFNSVCSFMNSPKRRNSMDDPCEGLGCSTKGQCEGLNSFCLDPQINVPKFKEGLRTDSNSHSEVRYISPRSPRVVNRGVSTESPRSSAEVHPSSSEAATPKDHRTKYVAPMIPHLLAAKDSNEPLHSDLIQPYMLKVLTHRLKRYLSGRRNSPLDEIFLDSPRSKTRVEDQGHVSPEIVVKIRDFMMKSPFYGAQIASRRQSSSVSLLVDNILHDKPAMMVSQDELTETTEEHSTWWNAERVETGRHTAESHLAALLRPPPGHDSSSHVPSSRSKNTTLSSHVTGLMSRSEIRDMFILWLDQLELGERYEHEEGVSLESEESDMINTIPKCVRWACKTLNEADAHVPERKAISDSLMYPILVDCYWQLIYGSTVLVVLLKFQVEFQMNNNPGIGYMSDFAVILVVVLLTITLTRLTNRYIESNCLKDVIFMTIQDVFNESGASSWY